MKDKETTLHRSYGFFWVSNWWKARLVVRRRASPQYCPRKKNCFRHKLKKNSRLYHNFLPFLSQKTLREENFFLPMHTARDMASKHFIWISFCWPPYMTLAWNMKDFRILFWIPRDICILARKRENRFPRIINQWLRAFNDAGSNNTGVSITIQHRGQLKF